MRTLHRLGARALVSATILLLAGVSAAAGGEPPPAPLGRRLLYPARVGQVPEPLRPHVERLLDPKQAEVPPAAVKCGSVFARVVSRKHVFDGGLRRGATLGARPFVFLTTPEALYGRPLLGVFSALGYSADSVLAGQLGEEKVVVIFRYGGEVAAHEGGTPPADWAAAVYPATWANLFALAGRLASGPGWRRVRSAGDPPDFFRLELREEREATFVAGFPEAGKRRVETTPYAALRLTGGADWEYRALLERALGAAEHFAGTGRTELTFAGPGRPTASYPEFLGPNRRLDALPEVAVVGLGSLRVVELAPRD